MSSAAVLTVRALRGSVGGWVELHTGALRRHGASEDSSHGTFGMGPRVLPSHTAQPMAQPELNQKHACPLRPESRPAPEGGPLASGTAHQFGPVESKATAPPGETGTGSVHGAKAPSTAVRGGGWTTEPWPLTSGTAASHIQEPHSMPVGRTEETVDSLSPNLSTVAAAGEMSGQLDFLCGAGSAETAFNALLVLLIARGTIAQ